MSLKVSRRGAVPPFIAMEVLREANERRPRQRMERSDPQLTQRADPGSDFKAPFERKTRATISNLVQSGGGQVQVTSNQSIVFGANGDITSVSINDAGLQSPLDLRVEKTRLWWGNTAGATGYDVVRGSLDQLQGTAGNLPLAAALTVVPMFIMGIYLWFAKRLGAFDAL